MIRAQAYVEDMVIAAATRLGRKCLIILDRGVLDPKAFASEEEWPQILSKVRMAEDDLRGRYDGVVHLVTSAKNEICRHAFQQGWVTDEQGSKTFRLENWEKAIERDSQNMAAYQGHRNRFIATNTEDGWDGKKKRVIDFMLKQIQVKRPLLRQTTVQGAG